MKSVWWKTKSEVQKEGWRGVTCVVRKKSEMEKEKEKEKEGGVVWCVRAFPFRDVKPNFSYNIYDTVHKTSPKKKLLTNALK